METVAMKVSVDTIVTKLSEIGKTRVVKTLSSERSIVCIVECEDCGGFVVTDPDFVSIFYLPEGESVIAITLCFYCERPVSSEVSYKMVKNLIKQGVHSFNWETGERNGIDE